MNVGVYKGASAMIALESWQDAIAQNLSAVAVPGYRRTETSFSAVAQDVLKLKKGDSVSQTLQGYMPKEERTLSFAPGSYTYTGLETNFAIGGEGFFRVRRPDGSLGYTRDGNFRIDQNYNLATNDGGLVEGDGGPITFRQEGGRVYINSEGLIIQGDQQLGRLAVYKFQNPADLVRVGNGFLGPKSPDNAATVVENAPIMHMTVEGSNVRLMEEAIQMISLGRAYEASKKVLDINDDATGKAIQYLAGQA